ncbi:radical SAM family heme chaperone HemW [Paenibacillus sp. YN15]|uniref:radical SAM family heme chaperone HemW n=1 Tax=Paenibacillus sp. YN15 TaxID=1742774 RepID=UPI000DCAF45C|nr:radical SAM family heme chaperone HemW [Paenibacillus sp. YN15]RAU94187.1 oxygen-independent coproporphyrinogen III oxidase [Paenibacillus sp. YN15]
MTDYRLDPPTAVYIHIPFCSNKCHYCDFTSYVVKGQPVDEYLDALEREMERTVSLLPPARVETIFVGGGTPTVLTPPQMERFLRMTRDYFPHWAEDIEFTMEANPGTTDPDKLAVMKEGGVNRVSFGVQSFDNGLLSGIGRIHQTEDVYRSLEYAQQAGFRNLTIDLMFGLPGQTLPMLEDTLDKALALSLQHYSIYGLKVEENTLFHNLYMKNQLLLPEEETEAEMFRLIMRRLEQEGFRQYEISNFAKPGFESRHNSMYWRNRAYYGLGAGAHGYANRERHMNLKGIRPYIEACKSGLPRLTTDPVAREEAMEDFMMVGLRLLEGVRGEDFRRQFGTSMEEAFGPVLEKLMADKLLDKTAEGYKLPQHAVMYGNVVFGAFIGHLTA